jgi:hypothetical protein
LHGIKNVNGGATLQHVLMREIFIIYIRDVATTRCGEVRTPHLLKIFAISQQKSVFLFKKKIIRWKNKVLHPPTFKNFVNISFTSEKFLLHPPPPPFFSLRHIPDLYQSLADPN